MGCKKYRQRRKRKNRGPERLAEWRILKQYGLTEVNRSPPLFQEKEDNTRGEELARQRGDVDENNIPLLTVVADGSWAKRSYRQNYNSMSGTNEKSLPKKKKNRYTKKVLQTDDVEETNGASDGTQNISNVTSVFIKQEVLESDEMMEETPQENDPFETVYLNSNTDQHSNDQLTKIKVEPLDDTEQEQIFPVNIKAEPLDIIDEQTVTSERCPECDEEVWDLERHIDEQHSETEGITLRKTNQKQAPFKRRKFSRPPAQTDSLASSMTKVTSTTTSSSYTSTQVEVEPLLASTSQSSTLDKRENPMSKQYVVLVPKTDVDKQSVTLPIAGPSPAAAPSPPLPPAPTTSLPSCPVDSSETFTISLARFPESQRIAIKKKVLEVVEAVERLKINPELIVIAHKAQTSSL